MAKHRTAGRREGLPTPSCGVPSASNANEAYSELVCDIGETPVLPHREELEGGADESEAPNARDDGVLEEE